MIAVRDLDVAAASFRALGFTLTPRGFHSIGSQNHCIMFGSTYLELLAAPVAHPWLDYYREFLAKGEGLAAVALATDDADRTYAEMKDKGARPPMHLSRPVEGGTARFRIVQVRNDLFYCQHLTRELVWRAEWQSHANGATELIAAAGSTLRINGLKEAADAHGVRLEPSR